MNFERKDNDPLRTLDIGKRALKKQKMQSLLYRERFGSYGMMWMGMGNIIDLIKETKDGVLKSSKRISYNILPSQLERMKNGDGKNYMKLFLSFQIKAFLNIM